MDLLETPSRVMRRLDILEGQSLPDLPELPSHSDVDYTLPDSPPPQQQPPRPAPRVDTSFNSDDENKQTDGRHEQHDIMLTPYASVPALKNRGPTHSSKILPQSATSSSSNYTTASSKTARPSRSGTDDTANTMTLQRQHHHQPLSKSQGPSLRQSQNTVDLDLPSLEISHDGTIEQDVHHEHRQLQRQHAFADVDHSGGSDQEINDSLDMLDIDRDDMVIISSGSGTESDRPATQPIKTAAKSPQREYDVPIADVSTEDDDDVGSTRNQNKHPMIPDSARARRLSAAGANISLRRPHHKHAQVTPKARAASTGTPSPLQQLDANRGNDQAEDESEEMSSPGMGRHASPVNSPHYSQHGGVNSSFPSLSTPSALREGKTGRYGNDTNGPAAAARFATPMDKFSLDLGPELGLGLGDGISPPQLAFSSPAAARRASHLLRTLNSTAKKPGPGLVRRGRGTPHPSRRTIASALRQSGSDGEAEMTTSQASNVDDDDVELSSSSANDLTTMRRPDGGNTSLPNTHVDAGAGIAGGGASVATMTGGRFNGAKLNAYLHQLNAHLASENQSLVQSLGEQARELETLRAGGGGGGNGSMSLRSASGSMSLSRSVGQLDAIREDHGRAENDNTQNEDELATLRQRISVMEREAQAKEDELERLCHRSDEDDAANELERARSQLDQQETEFADKMRELEAELCRVMEEQERGVENARNEAELARQRDRARVDEIALERDQLRQELEDVKAEQGRSGDDNSLNRQEDHARVVADLERHVAELEDTLAKRDEVVSTLEARQVQLEADIEAKNREAEQVRSDLAEQAESLQQDLERATDELRQMEEALDESARQLIAHEDELEAVKAELAAERNTATALKAQISQLSLTKAKSPLANEAYNGNHDNSSSVEASSIVGVNQEDENNAAANKSMSASTPKQTNDSAVIASLEDELEEAHHEIQQLREQIAKSSPAAHKAALEIQDLQIKTLQTQKSDLEGRVQSLKQQVASKVPSTSFAASIGQTPEKSLMFRPLLGLKTPKTPGPFLGNLSAWSPGGSGADTTISPLLAQIHELEQIVVTLQAQLLDANEQIDDKLDKLEASGSGTISLARQLADARARVALLEGELERLVGQHGSLERVRARLESLSCPACEATFDAAKLVHFTFDRSVLLGASNADGNTTATNAANESLQTTLARLNAKLAALETENSLLQGASSQARALAKEKASVMKQHAALQKDFQQARTEIASLEVELRTDRSRLKTLSSEQALSGRTKASLEARLASAETELRNVKRELSSAVAPDLVNRLRREKSELVAERADLLQQLNALNDRAAQVDDDLNTTKASQLTMQAQLDRQIAEIQTLRDSLVAHEAEKRTLTDERVDILRGVASLQADLNRVRQDAVSLGLDLANVRRERDEMGRMQLAGADLQELDKMRAELARAKSKAGAAERKLADHVCASSNEGLLMDVKARHAQEAKGLLVMIKYLKLRITREVSFRDDLASQKTYLTNTVAEKQAAIDMVMGQLGIRPSSDSSKRGRSRPMSLRGAALAVIAISRMNSMSQIWRQQSAPKERLRSQAYPDARGRPFPRAA